MPSPSPLLLFFGIYVIVWVVKIVYLILQLSLMCASACLAEHGKVRELLSSAQIIIPQIPASGMRKKRRRASDASIWISASEMWSGRSEQELSGFPADLPPSLYPSFRGQTPLKYHFNFRRGQAQAQIENPISEEDKVCRIERWQNWFCGGKIVPIRFCSYWRPH